MVSTNSSECVEREFYGGEELERHTFTGLINCTFEGVGVTHFFDEEEIRKLMGPFRLVELGYEERVENTLAKRPEGFAQWIVVAEK